MNEAVGNVSFEQPQPGEMVFDKPFSEHTAQLVDEEAKKSSSNTLSEPSNSCNNPNSSNRFNTQAVSEALSSASNSSKTLL